MVRSSDGGGARFPSRLDVGLTGEMISPKHGSGAAGWRLPAVAISAALILAFLQTPPGHAASRIDRWEKYSEYDFVKDSYEHDGATYSYGYDKDGYGADGYDRRGYDRSGYSRAGYDESDKRDRDGYDCNGYDKEGYDREGRNGYDRDGRDRKGHDRDGYDSEGYDENGYDHAGYDREGYDCNGYDSSGHHGGTGGNHGGGQSGGGSGGGSSGGGSSGSGGIGNQPPDPVSVAPEPESWLMMLTGFLAAGFALRRRPARAMLA